MIKFFRKIRQKLLTENKFSKYLKYAIGEILLVVIGILIALQVNNWNIEKIENQEENHILSSFHEELIANKSIIHDKKLWYEDIKSAIVSLQKEATLPKENLNSRYLDTLIGKISWHNTTSIQMATSDAIILGGKLPLFSNKNLRLVITEWNGKIDWVQQNERQDYDSMESYWMPFLQEHGFLPQISNSITEMPGVGNANYGTNVTVGSNYFDHSALVTNREFQNVLLRRLWVVDDIINTYEQLEPELDQLISIVSAEISK